jgi:hypothetical protein
MYNKNFQLTKRAAVVLIISLSSITGCSTLNNMDALNTSSDTTMNSDDIAAYAANQDAVYQSLLTLAGLPDQPASTEDWNQLIMAGVQYSNQKCENYLDAVNWSKQGSQRESSLLGQSGTFTNGIMGIAKASARELALTAAAFGYARAGFDTVNEDVLAGLEASSVRNLVHTMQQQYVERIQANQYTNRVGAFNALQGYIRLCMPGNIAAEANQAVRSANAVDQSALNSINLAPAISLHAPTTPATTVVGEQPLLAPTLP